MLVFPIKIILPSDDVKKNTILTYFVLYGAHRNKKSISFFPSLASTSKESKFSAIIILNQLGNDFNEEK